MFARAPRAQSPGATTRAQTARRIAAAAATLTLAVPAVAEFPLSLTTPPQPKLSANSASPLYLLGAPFSATDDRAELAHRASRSTVRVQLPTVNGHQIPATHVSAGQRPSGRPTRNGLAPKHQTPRPASVAAPAVHATGRAAVAVAFALTQVGKPYRFGASGPDSYDCSGLVMASWAHAGVQLPHSSGGIAGAGRRIPTSQAQPGDVLVWTSARGVYHVALYLGGGRMVEAPHAGTSVHVASIWANPYAVRVD